TGFTSDAMGHVVSDGTWNYTWSAGSRIVSRSDGVETVAYEHDAFGNIRRRNAREHVWNYALELPSVSIVREAGVDIAYYIHSPAGHLLYRIEAAGGARRFYHFDEMGHTLFLTGDDGSVTDSYAYGP